MLIRQNTYNLLLIAILLVIIDLSKQTKTNSKCPQDFQCNNTDCISRMKVCDGKFNCSDNSDEKNCDIKVVGKCPTPEIRNGKYEIMGNNDYIAGQPIPNLATVKFTCTNPNYILTKRYNTVKCLQGNYSEEIPKCISICIPEFPNTIDVECELDGIEQDCRKKVLEGTTAYMKCKPNYIDNSPDISKTVCSNGTWSSPPKQCTSPYSCPPRHSSALDIMCELNGVRQECTKEVPDGTIAYMNCKPNYVDLKEPGSSFAICSKGSWNKLPKQCVPDCDQIITKGKTFVINGETVERGEFPWHVAIYRQKPEKPIEYICRGSIISVKIVISAAHCFTVPSNGELYPISEFSLAAGKQYSNWDASEDAYYVQKRKIIKIEIPSDIYIGDASNHAGDLAVLVVDQTLILTSYIKPVVGWGSTTGDDVASINLRELKLPFVKRSECTKIVPKNFIHFITTDKYCAGYTNGSNICVGDSGGGMVFPQEAAEKSRYYLQGIVSVGPKKDNNCDNNQLGVYTEVNKYIKFIRNIEESNRLTFFTKNNSDFIIKRLDGTCPTPVIENGKFEVLGQAKYILGHRIPNFSIVNFICHNDNYVLDTFYSSVNCLNGLYSNNLPNCVSTTCPARFSNSIDVDCELFGVKQDCLKEVAEGTIATMKCSSYGETYPGPTTATCSRGSWDVPLKECTPECKGSHMISEESIQVCGEIISNTTKELDIVKKGEFPWHVGIYRKEPEVSNYLFCGGSIISEKIVLSAAHCFTNLTNGKLFTISEFSVAAGKQFSDWDAPRDINFVQKRKICKIEIPNNYSGGESKFAGDLAVIFVDKPFEFSNVVKPICVDWNLEYTDQQLKGDAMGQVTGWDISKALNVILTYSTIPVVELNQCYKTVPTQSRLYITDDKYCIGNTNGTNICSASSGGGMAFLNEKLGKKKYYIQGIQSTGLLNLNYCDSKQLTAYTRVIDYISFIRNVTSLKQII